MLDCNDDTVAYQNHYSSVPFFLHFLLPMGGWVGGAVGALSPLPRFGAVKHFYR